MISTRALKVACVVALGYVLWAGYYVHYHPVASLAHVGSQFQKQGGGRSDPISQLHASSQNAVGYDGQFFLYVALDPLGARPYLDVPAYRYSRPAYPLAARVLALGRSGAVPWTLLLLGIAGAAAVTFAASAWAEREGLSPWYGALLGVYPGVFLAVSWDLSEALGYGLAALGLLAFGRSDERGVTRASLLFAAAAVTRETTLLFPIAFAVWLAFHARRRDAARLLALAFGPYVALKIGLALWLHSAGAARATHVEPLPFLGLIRQWPWGDAHVQQILSVVLPGLLAVVVAWRAIGELTPAMLALIANVLFLVVLLPEPSYVDYLASGRIAIGVVLAFVLCLPAVLRRGRYAEAWIVLTLWLLPWYTVLPEAVRRS
jgi:hypothetical protein